MLHLIGLIFGGIAFIAIAEYIFKTYREFFIRDPERSLTSDLLFAIFSCGWSVPVVIAALLLYMGILLFGVGVFFAFVILKDIYFGY